MYVKIMGPEDLSDDDSRKTYRLFADVLDVTFTRGMADPTEVFARVVGDGYTEVEQVRGNVYIMNDDGLDVASFGPAVAPDRVSMADRVRDAVRKGDLAPRSPADPQIAADAHTDDAGQDPHVDNDVPWSGIDDRERYQGRIAPWSGFDDENDDMPAPTD